MIGTGKWDWLGDSLVKVHLLEEFGITPEQALPHAFKQYMENSSRGSNFYQQMCWEFLPEEESCVSEFDYWGCPSQPVVDKRIRFLSNIDHIEKLYGGLLEEFGYVYGEAFYKLNNLANDIKIIKLDDQTTCLHYWK